MRWRLLSGSLTRLWFFSATITLTWAAMAQTPSLDQPIPKSKVKPPQMATETGPKWSELSQTQQAILAPLQHLWSGMEENRKRKWLAIVKNWPALTPQAQATAQERMKEWAALSPAQRAQARLNFAQSQQLSTDEKKAKWEAFQTLNEEEKLKLTPAKPGVPKGAATAVKPIAPEKLTATPKPRQGQVKAPRIETTEVHPQTLLPVRKTSMPVDGDK